jgi:DNA-binding response OmpR family regulator
VVNEKEKKRILVIDDDQRILRFIRLSLTASGYEAITATDGEESLRLVKSEKPSVMLLDVFMPGMDGFQVLKGLRAFSDIPVLVFSARHSAAEKALSLGANDFIAKPFSPEALLRRIEALLSQAK